MTYPDELSPDERRRGCFGCLTVVVLCLGIDCACLLLALAACGRL